MSPKLPNARTAVHMARERACPQTHDARKKRAKKQTRKHPRRNSHADARAQQLTKKPPQRRSTAKSRINEHRKKKRCQLPPKQSRPTHTRGTPGPTRSARRKAVAMTGKRLSLIGSVGRLAARLGALLREVLVRASGGQEGDNHGRHVVAADAANVALGREARVEQFLDNLLEWHKARDARTDEIDDVLVAHHVPDAVAREDDKLFPLRQWFCDDLREHCHNLVLRRHGRVCLELKIANCTGEREVPVHTAKLHKAASRCYPLALALVDGLVVKGERDLHTARGENAARVPGIAAIYLLVLDENAHRRRTRRHILHGGIREHVLVCLEKAVLYGGLIIALHVLRVVDNLRVHPLARILGHLRAAVAVVHRKERRPLVSRHPQ
eukprot:Opistho-1_new@13526